MNLFAGGNNIGYIAHIWDIFFCIQGHSDPSLASLASCPACSVDIGGACSWNIIIHHAVDAAEVYAPRKQVCGYEDPDFAFTEIGHDGRACGGGEVRVKDCKAGGASGFRGDVIHEFSVEGDGSGNGLREDKEGGLD